MLLTPDDACNTSPSAPCGFMDDPSSWRAQLGCGGLHAHGTAAVPAAVMGARACKYEGAARCHDLVTAHDAQLQSSIQIPRHGASSSRYTAGSCTQGASAVDGFWGGVVPIQHARAQFIRASSMQGLHGFVVPSVELVASPARGSRRHVGCLSLQRGSLTGGICHLSSRPPASASAHCPGPGQIPQCCTKGHPPLPPSPAVTSLKQHLIVLVACIC